MIRFSNWDVGLYITLESQCTPIGEAIKQQTQWPMELSPRRHPFGGAVENDRQILEDEEGLLIAPLSTEATDYAAINPTIRGWRTPRGIHSILHLYHNSEWKEEIRAGGRKRIVFFLKAGSDLRALRTCPFDQSTYGDLEMSLTQYVLFTNMLDIWQEALENLGWPQADIDSLWDEEQYLGFARALEWSA